MNRAKERRMRSERRLVEKLDWPLRLSRKNAWRLLLIIGCLTGVVDFMTSAQVWLGPLYLIIIALAAWSLGWAEAVGTGFVCLSITLTANGYELYPYPGIAGAWNIGARVVAVLALIGLLHAVRQMYAREWRVSRTDTLTGALNRKAFFELTSARTNFRAWSMLVYADMDGFKRLNDRRGHAAGDECLVRFVRQVSKSIRKEDIFARIGGDEFAIYLDVRDRAAAQAVALRLHSAMNAVALACGTSTKCSVGALILEPGARSIDFEVRSADALMYQAKELGSSLVIGIARQVGGDVTVLRYCDERSNFIGRDESRDYHSNRVQISDIDAEIRNVA